MASPIENIINSWLTNVVTKSNWTEGILHTDTMFSLGMNDINIYNIANNNCVLTELQPVSVDNPFNTGQELVITNTGYASPNLGGFSFDDTSFSDRVIITRFWAKIPIGYQVDFFGDEIGDNAISYWYSSNQGTGVFTEYVNILICGNTGTFSKANSFALFGEAGTIENPITWSIASASSYDLSSSYYQYFQTNRISEDLAVTTLDLDVTKQRVTINKKAINTKNKKLNTLLDFRDNSVLGFFSYSKEVIVSVQPNVIIIDKTLSLVEDVYMFNTNRTDYYSIEPQDIELIDDEVNYIYVKGTDYGFNAVLHASIELMPFTKDEDKFYLIGYVNPEADGERNIEYTYIGDLELAVPVVIDIIDINSYTIELSSANYPTVIVLDSKNYVVDTSIRYISRTQIQVTWGSNITGKIIIKN